ncbi:hypothetical protein QJS10_CPA01g01618 [Acorus calamus]|uniref:DUF538 family protein n=1 Tax=Acorus calamus TaxID=4465 RepID=A0AAV9FNK8_ACOCL|nr:hypothetical protein QJS10_CPA01g01618 [Acorus calamus]
MSTMATELTIEAQRPGAEVYHGDALGRKKSMELLEEISLPLGLLPLEDIEEVGYNRSTGFVWLRQKKAKNHLFKKINRLTSYGTEITALAQERRLKKVTGVKTRELLIWVSLTDIYIDDPASGKITFKTPTGLSRSFPVTAFDVEEEEVKKINEAAEKEVAEAAAATVE